jgi:hypothetical protein
MIVTAFLLSRLAYYWAGIRFDSSDLACYLQFIDPKLLREHYLQSIFYYHAQPPLFNMFVGGVLNLFPAQQDLVFTLVWGGRGLVMALAMFRLMVEVGVSERLSMILTILFIVGPSAILYENWLFYTYPVTVLLTLAAYYLHRYGVGNRTRDLLIFFLLVAIINLTRSLFHIVWFVAIVAILLYCRRGDWRRIALTALVPFLLVLGLYVKNQIIVGSFSTSTWLGMNLSRKTTFLVPDQDRREMVARGELSPLALIGIFIDPSEYRDVPHDTMKTGIPVLDQELKSTGCVNANNREFVSISRIYLHDAIYVSVHRPMVFLEGTARATFTYFLPASNYYYLRNNRPYIRRWDRLYNLIVLGQFVDNDSLPTNADTPGFVLKKILARSWVLLLGVPFLFVYSYRLIRSSGKGFRSLTGFQLTLLFILMTYAYVTLVGNLLEIIENNRFRFSIEPYFFIMAGIFLTYRWRTDARRRLESADPDPTAPQAQ